MKKVWLGVGIGLIVLSAILFILGFTVWSDIILYETLEFLNLFFLAAILAIVGSVLIFFYYLTKALK